MYRAGMAHISDRNGERRRHPSPLRVVTAIATSVSLLVTTREHDTRYDTHQWKDSS